MRWSRSTSLEQLRAVRVADQDAGAATPPPRHREPVAQGQRLERDAVDHRRPRTRWARQAFAVDDRVTEPFAVLAVDDDRRVPTIDAPVPNTQGPPTVGTGEVGEGDAPDSEREPRPRRSARRRRRCGRRLGREPRSVGDGRGSGASAQHDRGDDRGGNGRRAGEGEPGDKPGPTATRAGRRPASLDGLPQRRRHLFRRQRLCGENGLPLAFDELLELGRCGHAGLDLGAAVGRECPVGQRGQLGHLLRAQSGCHIAHRAT
jgi:hypothetical protein